MGLGSQVQTVWLIYTTTHIDSRVPISAHNGWLKVGTHLCGSYIRAVCFQLTIIDKLLNHLT